MNKIVRSRILSNLDWLVHGSTTRAFNPHPEGDRELEIRRLCEHAGIKPLRSAGVLYARQKHTANVFFLDHENKDPSREATIVREETDGVGTGLPGVLACIFTADCIPLFLVDPVKRQFLLIHAGWRGTLSGIAGKGVRVLQEKGSSPSDLLCWMGPFIGLCCYEVSLELAGRFSRAFPTVHDAVRGRHLDLGRINSCQLEQRGIRKENIEICGSCTKCNSERFYSYRARGDLGGRIYSFAFIP